MLGHRLSWSSSNTMDLFAPVQCAQCACATFVIKTGYVSAGGRYQFCCSTTGFSEVRRPTQRSLSTLRQSFLRSVFNSWFCREILSLCMPNLLESSCSAAPGLLRVAYLFGGALFMQIARIFCSVYRLHSEVTVFHFHNATFTIHPT